MRIAIIGAGAIGSALGAMLARNGRDVVLIGRPAQIDAIRKDGLQVDGCLGEFTVEMQVAETLDFKPDLVLLTVKTQDVLAAVRDNLAYLNDVPLVTLQNGVRSDGLAANLLPHSQLLSAVVFITATYLTPGRVTVIQQGMLVVGRPFGPKDALADKAAQILNSAIPTRTSDNIKGAHWLKLIINLNNALPALTNFTVSQVYKDPYLSRLAVGLMCEGLHVTAQARIRLESLPKMPVGLIRLVGSLPIGLATRMMAALVRRMDTDWPLLGSTLQSIRRNRPTEIDYLNGEVVQLGKQVGVPTPLNAKVVELVHYVERTGRFLSVNEIRRAAGGSLREIASKVTQAK